ncbi:MAG: dihydrodipicolinate synthase family protein [Trichococcus sp.]|uniref:dihydrodipicolinate synthase family protein n=1 Tax=Trichococcus sp. TaxID=1985464 RepID=UPI003C31C182
MTKVKNWKTIFPAISIPLNDDYSINEAELRPYVRWLASFDEIGGLVCNGHTGEITSLTRAERARVVEIVAEEVGDQMTIISGINCENTQESIEMAREAKEAGADGILLMPPHMWLRFGMNPAAPFEYVKDVADGADIDIIIHLYPATSKAFYPVETLIKMANEIEHVKSIKMGTRVTALYENDIRELRKHAPDVSLITCHDETLLTSMFPGMDGALIGFAGCIPELITEAWKAMKAGDFQKIRQYDDLIFPISKAIYGGGQPSGEAHARMKEALVQRGVFTSALMRKPVLPLDQEEKDGITQGLKDSTAGDVSAEVAKFKKEEALVK